MDLEIAPHNRQIQMGSYDQPLRFVGQNGTPIRIDRAAVPAQQYDYVPGAVVLSKVQGYNATATGKVQRFSSSRSVEIVTTTCLQRIRS